MKKDNLNSEKIYEQDKKMERDFYKKQKLVYEEDANYNNNCYR